ncbi:hypothetical protein TNIN_117491 [Trichonephila inaurata madagascariensis]|uniref:Uncharacterized protein n=1 Tax=Trichonephila inaurata madagascariensis TaxID=2747483 RepID=A0A8X6X2S6_9ARAC|nr:hypothetical protein TNIN_117491 [Trichonephila inaurata madagascariensis]
MAANVSTKQNSSLQETVVFSVALDKGTNVNDVAPLTVTARYCDKDQVYEELCAHAMDKKERGFVELLESHI